MELQKRFIDEHAGLDQLAPADWGVVLRQLEKFVRAMRDLAQRDTTTDVVIFTTGVIPDDTGKYRPLLQGQLKLTLPYFVDVVGYLYVRGVPQESGEIVTERTLAIQPMPQVVAKDGTGKLGGPTISNPDITELFGRLGEGAV